MQIYAGPISSILRHSSPHKFQKIFILFTIKKNPNEKQASCFLFRPFYSNMMLLITFEQTLQNSNLLFSYLVLHIIMADVTLCKRHAMKRATNARLLMERSFAEIHAAHTDEVIFVLLKAVLLQQKFLGGLW